MKTLAQKSIAAVRKANKQWKISLCSGAMMELVRCMELNNANVAACRGPIEAMTKCVAGKKYQVGYNSNHPFADPALLTELLKHSR
ncbi:hypothetical protein BLSTO_00066 [Blastocystis sp. subtype 1]